jgi:hypothetical protein
MQVLLDDQRDENYEFNRVATVRGIGSRLLEAVSPTMIAKESEMSDKVTVIGVYPVPGNTDVHMIEVLVNARPSEFDVGKFTQENPSLPQDSWQVAWSEYYLNESGDIVIGDYFNEPSGDTESTRLVFYLFDIVFEYLLLTPFGPVSLPKSTSMPKRLERIISFEEPD